MTGLLLFTHVLMGQALEKLTKLSLPEFNVYCSKSFERPSTVIAQRLANALSYHEQLLGFKPSVTLLVLSAADWGNYTSFPVYGMPHYTDNKTLVVAIEDNPFWQSFIPPLDQLPKELADQIRTTYSNNEKLTMQPFFDLLAIHELGHAFHTQGGLNMQRMWMGELFCNIFLHTYVAEKEPKALPALTVFPNMVVAAGAKEYTYTRLQDIEERYNEIGQQHAKNYGWFQCRWHAGAAKVYDVGGKEVSVKLWQALKQQKEKLQDDAFVNFLEQNVATSLADLIRNWDKETKF
ncbi:MAG: hypothetical protein KF725_10790 [Cyclobacteriaceae bacterium]|nr:hypothetical protein [Cyclobacteriaceae bacterium]UYN86192.1 MAG: hypothetical protein KIT51_15180 [Cyclobacteriaceae bacterium]